MHRGKAPLGKVAPGRVNSPKTDGDLGLTIETGQNQAYPPPATSRSLP